MPNAVVLLSGGLDSATCLAYAKAQGFDCFALSFDYHQRHQQAELAAAKTIAAAAGVAHKIFSIALDQFGGSALTDPNLAVPNHGSDPDPIPITYVPARNTIFLAIALAWAEVVGAEVIFIGVSHIDYSNYPDCRPEYIAAFQALANLATKQTVQGDLIKIHTPLINLSKAETIQLGVSLGVDYSKTVSCYQAIENGLACGQCDSCTFRKRGFAQAGLTDPTRYLS